MINISHRGNTNGKDKWENHPDKIIEVLKNYNVEIDVWITDSVYLGHDKPEYKVDYDFLNKENLWCHAKNYNALSYMLKNNIHCFWHENDKFTITSKNFIWQYPSDIEYDNSIFLMPELFDNINLSKCVGICSDYIDLYK